MREGGLEPPIPFGNQILNLARLPIPPLSRGWGILSHAPNLPGICDASMARRAGNGEWFAVRQEYLVSLAHREGAVRQEYQVFVAR